MQGFAPALCIEGTVGGQARAVDFGFARVACPGA
jgi:hypothetical protein